MLKTKNWEPKANLNHWNGLLQFTSNRDMEHLRIFDGGVEKTFWGLANRSIVGTFDLGQYKSK
jgi:hypothetical protein